MQIRSDEQRALAASSLSPMMLATSSRQLLPANLTSKPRSTLSVASRTRVRRAFNAVDTNVASYDRKDPFAAFNTLRKLIAILPSRIGGCQFRLTPEEQKLSMHLLTIVEPFIGLSPSRRTLTRQPTEILDQIVGHLDSKRDLLALALSCKRMHDVIFPRHYEYRVVRCKVSNIAVWSHLSIHRGLAQNVRRLEILDERSADTSLIPSDILTTDTELESSDDELTMHVKQGRLFGTALSKLTSLNEFVWSCNHSLISLYSIWPTLLKCCTLKSVEINDNLVFGPVADDDETSKSKRVLPQLSSVAVRSIKKGYGQNKDASLTRVNEMLHHCPNLQSLDISYSSTRNGFAHPRADDFFLCGRWPSLRTLTLTNLACSTEGFGAVSAFLLVHVNIEILHLDLGRFGAQQLILPPNTLPRLRELRCNKELAIAILTCPSETARPLETLKGIRLTGQAWDAQFFGALRMNGNTLKRIELAGYSEFEDIRRLAECVPKVSWLDIGKKTNANVNSSVAISNVVDWAELLTQLPELTAFHSVRFFYEVSDAAAAGAASGSTTTNMSMSDRSRIRKNDEVASVLAWKCPKLRRLDHWDENSGKVIVLLKDGEKTRWEVRRIKL